MKDVANCLLDTAYKYDKKPSTKATVCMTPACVHASSEILYNLSPEYKEIDPCTDFEELVCGGWGDRHDLRPDQGDAFTGTIMSENSQMLLRHILEAPYPDESKVGHVGLPKEIECFIDLAYSILAFPQHSLWQRLLR